MKCFGEKGKINVGVFVDRVDVFYYYSIVVIIQGSI